MKKLYIHQNEGEPIWVARSEDQLIYVVYRDELISAHDTIRSAIDFATNEYIGQEAKGPFGWQPIQ
jgi:hypothetical protein